MFFGVVSGVKIWTDEYYVFRAVLGGLVVQMRVDDGPVGWNPFFLEIFTPQFTAILPISGCEFRCGCMA